MEAAGEVDTGRNPRGRPVTRTVSLLSRKKSFWRMFRSLLIPSTVAAVFAACGGSTSRRRRRLEKYRNKGRPPLCPRSNTTTSRNPPVAQTASTTSIPNSDETTNRTGSASSIVTVQVQMQGLSLLEEETPEDISTTSANVISPTTTTTLITATSENVLENVSVAEETLETFTIGNEGESAYNRSFRRSISAPVESLLTQDNEEAIVVLRRPKKDRESVASSIGGNEFHGWRKSSIEITTEPPLTLKWIPSGLQLGDRVLWIREDEIEPERGSVRWIGKIRQQFYAGVEFDRGVGNSSGLYGYGGGLVARLFTCDLGYGKFLPIEELVLYSDYHDKGVKAGFICIICRDDFLELPDCEGEEGHMVATKCGHLYHETCLQQWLAAKSKGKSNVSQPCPHCQNPIRFHDIIRLFPAQV